MDREIVFGPTDDQQEITFIIQDDVIENEPTESLRWSLNLTDDVERVFIGPYQNITIDIVENDCKNRPL